MRNKVCSLFLRTFAAASMLTSCGYRIDDGASDFGTKSSAIVGGESVEANDDLSGLVVGIAGIGHKRFGSCTGSFVAEDIILTAAHCFKKQDLNIGYHYFAVFKNSFSGSDITSARSSDYAQIVSITFGKDVENDDIALARIDQRKPSRFRILNLQSESIDEPGTFLALGYGKLGHRSDTGPATRAVLGAVEIGFRSVYRTGRYFSYDQRSGKGICLGDSGGPNIIFKDGEPYLIGMTWVVRYDEDLHKSDKAYDICRQFGRSLSIPYYFRWLEKNIKAMTKY